MTASREIHWDGFFNARDLGRLPTRSGRTTRRGTFIRSADLRFVTDAGWRAARGSGIRTVIDLRNEDEIRPGCGEQPSPTDGFARFAPAASGPTTLPGIDRLEVPFDDVEDAEFWQYVNREQLDGSPLYYRPFLERKPDRCAAVFHALAHAAAGGGVLFHCGVGRDRTGLVTLLLLALVDVDSETIAADYALSTESATALFAAMGTEDEGPFIKSLLARRRTTAPAAIMATLDGFDAEDYLLNAGVGRADLQVIRSRLLG